MFKPAIIVHGGAWAIPDKLSQRSLDGVKAAARRGHEVLTSDGSAVDAVVAAVSVLEDNTAFDAGHGAVLNLKGEVELDAIVIDGKTLKSGAVCGVQGCANPVQLARCVMDKTNHCLLSGAGANDFMASEGITRVPDSQLVTPEARQEWETYMHFSSTVKNLFSDRTASPPQSGCDTVGAVAMDANGNLAAATSTGGITAKLPGRVGDSPIIGAGAYADSLVGAVSTTGHGESIMKVCLARRVGELLEKGETAQQAAEQALEFMTKRVGGAAGLIVLSKAEDDGTCQIGHHFNTARMAWAAVKDGILSCGIDPGQELTSTLDSLY